MVVIKVMGNRFGRLLELEHCKVKGPLMFVQVDLQGIVHTELVMQLPVDLPAKLVVARGRYYAQQVSAVKEILYDVSVSDANKFFFWQMLNGDTSDNIPGIKGVGPKTIAKLFEGIDDVESLRSIVQEQYAKQYGVDWQQAYLEVGNLLWMIRVDGKECPLL